MSKPRPGGKVLKSDETLIDILRVLLEQERAGITEIATRVGTAKSNVYYHLNTLEQNGLVVNENGKYRLGLWLFDFGTFARQTHGLYEVIKPQADRLAKMTGERVWCAAEEHGQSVYIYGTRDEQSTFPEARVGGRYLLHQTAAGKAILAFRPKEFVETVVDRYGLEPRTEHTITDKETLFEQLENIRDWGYAYNREESELGLVAVGVPILDEQNRAVGAISISQPNKHRTSERIETEIPELLLDVVGEIEVNLIHR